MEQLWSQHGSNYGHELEVIADKLWNNGQILEIDLKTFNYGHNLEIWT